MLVINTDCAQHARAWQADCRPQKRALLSGKILRNHLPVRLKRALDVGNRSILIDSKHYRR